MRLDALLALVVFWLTLAVLAVPLELADGFYVAHAYIPVLALYCLVSQRSFFSPPPWLLILSAVFIIADLSSYALRQSVPPYFLREFVKLHLLLLGTWAFSRLFSRAQFYLLLTRASLCVVAYIALYLVFIGDPFTYGGRLQVETMGSSNTLAVILAFCAVVLLGDIAEGRGRRAGAAGASAQKLRYSAAPGRAVGRVGAGAGRRSASGVAQWMAAAGIKVGAVMVVIALLALSESRGGFFAFAIGFLVLSVTLGVRFFAAVAAVGTASCVAFAAFPELQDRFFNIDDRYSSGRTEVWTYLIDSLSDSPQALMLGFGSGSVDFELMNKSWDSAHSGPLTIAYYYGLPALFVFAAFAFALAAKLLKEDGPSRFTKLGLYAGFLVTFVTDNLFLASQGTIYFSMFLGFLIAKPAIPKVAGPRRTGRHRMKAAPAGTQTPIAQAS